MTKRRVERRLDELQAERDEETDAPLPATDLTVVWDAAVPDTRAEGQTYDPEAGELIYEVLSDPNR